MGTKEYLITQDIYNQLHLFEQNGNQVPFWTLNDNEQYYYKWLFGKDKYFELRRMAYQKYQK